MNRLYSKNVFDNDTHTHNIVVDQHDNTNSQHTPTFSSLAKQDNTLYSTTTPPFSLNTLSPHNHINNNYHNHNNSYIHNHTSNHDINNTIDIASPTLVSHNHNNTVNNQSPAIEPINHYTSLFNIDTNSDNDNELPQTPTTHNQNIRHNFNQHNNNNGVDNNNRTQNIHDLPTHTIPLNNHTHAHAHIHTQQQQQQQQQTDNSSSISIPLLESVTESSNDNSNIDDDNSHHSSNDNDMHSSTNNTEIQSEIIDNSILHNINNKVNNSNNNVNFNNNENKINTHDSKLKHTSTTTTTQSSPTTSHATNTTTTTNTTTSNRRSPPITNPLDSDLYSPVGSSKVWQIFRLCRADPSWAYCCAGIPISLDGHTRRCGKWFVYHHPTTSNLKNHIYMQHKTTYDALYPKQKMFHVTHSHKNTKSKNNKTNNQDNSTNNNHNDNTNNTATISSHKKRRTQPITVSDVPLDDYMKYNPYTYTDNLTLRYIQAMNQQNHHNNNNNVEQDIDNNDNSKIKPTTKKRHDNNDTNTIETQSTMIMLFQSHQYTLHMCHLLSRVLERIYPSQAVKQELQAIYNQQQQSTIQSPNDDSNHNINKTDTDQTIKFPILDATLSAQIKVKQIEQLYNTRNITHIVDTLFHTNVICTYNNTVHLGKHKLQNTLNNMLNNDNNNKHNNHKKNNKSDQSVSITLFSASSNHITMYIHCSNDKTYLQLLTFDMNGLITQCVMYDHCNNTSVQHTKLTTLSSPSAQANSPQPSALTNSNTDTTSHTMSYISIPPFSHNQHNNSTTESSNTTSSSSQHISTNSIYQDS